MYIGWPWWWGAQTAIGGTPQRYSGTVAEISSRGGYHHRSTFKFNGIKCRDVAIKLLPPEDIGYVIQYSGTLGHLGGIVD